MYFRDIFRLLSTYLFAFSLSLVIPLFIAGYFEFFTSFEDHPQPHSTVAFFLTFVGTLSLSLLFRLCSKGSKGNLYRREGLLAVVIIWLLTPMIAAVPFVITGTLKDPFQAYFETCSGFTTTGATVIQAKKFDHTGSEIPIEKTFCGVIPVTYTYYGNVDPVKDPVTGIVLYEGIEAIGKALLFWRSFTNWLGGMGIIVLFVAVLPALGVGGKMLFQAEVPGPVKESLTPRIKETAGHLWKIYVGLTLIQFLLLLWAEPSMDWFYASTVTFSTLSTGGFTPVNASIGQFQSPSVDWICIIFMIAGGINFSLYYHILKGKFYRIWEPEFFLFLSIMVIITGITVFYIQDVPIVSMKGVQEGFFSGLDSIRVAAFQVVSCMTTTGFSIVDYDRWPYSVQVLLLIIMFIGGMAGSTVGGLKTIRLLMLFRVVQYKVESIFRPETVRRFKIGALEVDTGASVMVLSYFAIVIAMSVFATLVYIQNGVDPESAIGLVANLINNVGMGFRMAAPTESVAFLNSFGLIFSSLLMILGRLEFLAFLAILVPAFWRETT